VWKNCNGGLFDGKRNKEKMEAVSRIIVLEFFSTALAVV